MDIMKLMKQAKNIKKMQGDIAKTTVEAEADGASVVLSGQGVVKSFTLSDELYEKGRSAVETATMKAFDECLKKQMDLYKEKAKAAMGGLDLSGLTG
jgi:DNA-binding protein YbaB